MEGAFTQRQPLPTAISKPRIDAFTWTLLGADAVSRTLDAYSTHRMLKNECGLQPQTPGLSTCNYEKYLPHSVSHNVTALYAFEGSAWLTQYFVVKLLVQHHHPRLARFVPVIDIAVTAPFAITNLTFPIVVPERVPQCHSNQYPCTCETAASAANELKIHPGVPRPESNASPTASMRK